MMVGEVRDAETADIALKAALTGHVVLSTLHNNDAPGAVLRLINMSLEPFMIASALRLVVAQRLIRRLCKQCRVGVKPGSEQGRARLPAVPPEVRAALAGAPFYEPGGCAECGGAGYRGRIAIFEVLKITDGIEELIQRASAHAIWSQGPRRRHAHAARRRAPHRGAGRHIHCGSARTHRRASVGDR